MSYYHPFRFIQSRKILSPFFNHKAIKTALKSRPSDLAYYLPLFLIIRLKSEHQIQKACLPCSAFTNADTICTYRAKEA